MWKDVTTDQYLIPDVDTFIEGHVYTVTVELMAENGYEFYVADGNNGSNYNFKPTNTATRAEAAQILYKFHMDFIV